MSLWLIVVPAVVSAAPEPAGQSESTAPSSVLVRHAGIGVGFRLQVPGFADPHEDPYLVTWSLTTLDTTGKYGTYRGLLSYDWELLHVQEVEEHLAAPAGQVGLGYARFSWYSFNRLAAIPYVLTMDDYWSMLAQDEIQHDFREMSINNLGMVRTSNQAGGLNILLPPRIRSKTFRRIFGGDRVGLNVTGDVSINGGFRRETRDQLQSNLAGSNANYNFRIDQSQRFTIVGQVGDKVSVRVDQDSERLFEFQNAIKLEYTGYDDEIIQKIEAGNVNLSLPGTRLAAFSAQNRGLFGIKTQLRVGALELTSIASLEKGEKNKLTVSSGSTQTTQIIYNTYPRLNTYFFVDNLYRENFRHFDATLTHETPVNESATHIYDFDLYQSVSTAGGNIVGTVTGWAVYDPINTNFDSLTNEDQNHQNKSFQLMQPTVDYELNPSLGYIRLTTPLATGTVLACAYRTLTDTIGDIAAIAPQPGDTSLIHLKLLRPQTPIYTDSTWNLMFRNVYYLNANNISQDGFQIRIKYQQSGAAEEEDQETPQGRLSYLTIFGLDRQNQGGAFTPDGLIDNNPSIVDWTRGEIIFPDLRPFAPEGYYVDGQLTGHDLLLADRQTPAIYDTSGYFPPSNFKIEVNYTNVSSVFNLGFNVLENSEEVYLNGARLSRGTDYTIDYLSGQLVILNQSALAPGADLEILYESGSIFQLDKKTLLGTRAEYKLWNDQSFIGGTLLYLSEKPLDRRVRVGSEPMRNFLWDVNSSMVFSPGILTEAVDALPLVESEAPSQIAVEAEIAKVYPNPNSLNSPSTGDNNGVAYVDDFESVKRATPLGIMRRAWTLASFPTGAVDADSNRGPMWWYNPYEQVLIQEIWPDREVNANVAQRTHVLTLRLHPNSQYNPALQREWNGIMRYLPSGYNDQSDAKYLEIWIRNENRNSGKLYIDLGQISEDIIPNDTLDTEDQPLENVTVYNPRNSLGNGVLDAGEDVGLDGHAGTDPADTWHINGLSNPAVPSLDDWSYTVANHDDYSRINGTEGNADDENGRYPDTEDLDDDNFLDLSDNFFRFGFEFNNAADDLRYIAGGQENPSGWRLYRIPLSDTLQSVGSPNWTQIQYARIWMTGYTSEAKVSIATVELAGNDWRETVLTDSGGSRDYVSVAVVNTHETPEYDPPPGVLGEVDPITNVRSKEQSLSLIVHGLPPENPAWVTRTLYQSESLIEYKKLKVFVHGGGTQMATFPDDQVEFLFKFGADTSTNYYEYIQTLYPGWDARNEIVIDFNALTSLKLDRPSDTTRWSEVFNDQGDSILVQGNPSLTYIQYMAFGVRRKHPEPPVLKISTEIWIDELRVSDVYRDPGMAGRASMTVNFADLANFTADINAQQAEFHNINIRVPGAYPSDQFNQSYSGSLHLDKLFNPRWGLNVPLTLNYSKNVAIPKYYAGSDILVDRSNPDDSVKTIASERGASFDFSKTTPSANPFVRYSIDKITFGYGITRRNSSSPTSLYSNTDINSGDVAYNWNVEQGSGLGIFSFLRNVPILSRMSESRLYYKPTHINLSLNGSENETHSMSRTGVYSRSYSLLVTRSLGTGIRPFESLTLDVTRTHRSDLSTSGVSGLLEGDLGRDNNISQTVNSSYNPEFLSFLTTETSYRTTYGWNWGNNYAESGQSVTNQSTLTASVELKTQDVVGRWVGGQRPSRPQTGEEAPAQPPGGEKEGPVPPESPQMQPGGSPRETGPIPGMHAPEQGRPEQPLPPLRREPSTTGAPSAPEGQEEPQKPESPEGKPAGEPEQQPAAEKRPPPTLLDGVKFLVSRLGNIRFDYSLQNNLSHPTVAGQADWRYQLGLSRSPGVPTIAGYTSIPSDARTDDYRVASALNLSRNVRLNLDYDFRKSANFGSTSTGSTEQTQFFILNRSQVKATDFFILNWSLSWSGLENTPLFEKLTQSVTFDNVFSGKRSDYWTGSESNVTRTTYDRSFNPLVGFTINWKGGVNSTIRYTLTQTLEDQLVSGVGKTYTTQTGLSAQVSYSRQTGFRIPLPFWPFKNRRFSNQTNFSLQFNMTSNSREGSVGQNGVLQEDSRQDSWSVSPRIDYTFSNTVTGGIHLETGVNKDKLQGKTSFMEFGVSVNIAIRG